MNGRNAGIVAALVGNPNVGKSTIFNRLTGLKQHTGNWPGKTVELVSGTYTQRGRSVTLIDLPGTYGMSAASEDERVTADFIRAGEADCIVAVCDGSCLARSLILVLQVLASSDRVVVCVNLMDEAKRKGVCLDGEHLSELLEAPVVLTSAGSGEGIDRLMEQIEQVADGPAQLRVQTDADPVLRAKEIAEQCAVTEYGEHKQLRRRVDALLVSRKFGVPLLILVLLFIVWLTVWGANGISDVLEWLFAITYQRLREWTAQLPLWLQGLLLDGMFATAGRVICVMLPPMAIFFPLFTLLEDFGYLPRMAFLLDPCMSRCGGCGRQALTLCMGLGCNAVGITGCRILSSPGQRMAAMLTNAFVPCNGRFPSLILLGSLLFPEAGAALIVAGCVALGVTGAMAISGFLNKTVYRIEKTTFLMEIPPFRRPRLCQILVRSLLDRTMAIAGRAVLVAAPAGMLLWLLTNTGIMQVLCRLLEPIGSLMGMNGMILTAFLFCIPANELLIPVLLMLLTGSKIMQTDAGMGMTLLQNELSWKNAVCMMVFTLFHWPCATALMTFYKETHSATKTAAAFVLPTAVGMVCCMLLNLIL